MNPVDRRARIIARLGTDGSEPQTDRLGQVCAEVTEMTGAGIMLLSDEGSRVSLCVTDETSETIERLQFELGEGPCIDAFRSDRPVLEPNLANPAAARWMLFSGPAQDAGARAVFGFPMRVGTTRVGAMNLYRDQTGALSADQHADALVMAEVAAQSVLEMQAGAAPGELGERLAASADFQLVVHQAAGMVAVQMEVGITEALVRLRARAFGDGRPVADVARDVVARRLRFAPDGRGKEQP